jgi:hypothetical protein
LPSLEEKEQEASESSPEKNASSDDNSCSSSGDEDDNQERQESKRTGHSEDGVLMEPSVKNLVQNDPSLKRAQHEDKIRKAEEGNIQELKAPSATAVNASSPEETVITEGNSSKEHHLEKESAIPEHAAIPDNASPSKRRSRRNTLSATSNSLPHKQIQTRRASISTTLSKKPSRG